MAKQEINIGTGANSNNGDPLRIAFNKINANFTELYTALGLDEAPLNLGAFEFTGSVLTTTDSSAIVIDQATTITSNLTVGGDVVPSVAYGGDLGTADKPWNSLYVSGDTVFIGGTPIRINESGDLTVDGSVVTSGDVSYNDLTDIPVIPTDISDLTDNTNLLGGGAANTGDITFNATTISAPNEDEIVIQSKASNGFGTARVTLNSEFGSDARLEAFSEETVETFTLANADFATGVWQDNGFGNGVVAFTGAQNIGDFFQNTLLNLTPQNVTIVINSEPAFTWPGGVSGAGTDTPGFGTNPIVPESPITITSIEFRYRKQSYISVNYSNQEIRLNAQDAAVRIDSGREIQMFGDESIELQSATFFNISAGEDINISTSSSFAARISAGDITLSANDDVRIDGTDSFRLINSSATAPIRIITNDGDIPRTWAFNPDGTLTFPDASIQSTAWTGSVGRSGVPIEFLRLPDPETLVVTPTPTSTGTKGEVVYAGGYVYICVATNTWVRFIAETAWE